MNRMHRRRCRDRGFPKQCVSSLSITVAAASFHLFFIVLRPRCQQHIAPERPRFQASAAGTCAAVKRHVASSGRSRRKRPRDWQKILAVTPVVHYRYTIASLSFAVEGVPGSQHFVSHLHESSRSKSPAAAAGTATPAHLCQNPGQPYRHTACQRPLLRPESGTPVRGP